MEIQEIKKYMKSNHITYEQLAQRSGLSISTIKKIFSGIAQYPRIDTMQAIEKALGLNTAPLQWTEADKALGVGSHPVKLTEKEWRILITYSQLNSDADTADDHENQLLYPDFSHRSILFPFAKEVFIGPKTPKYIENHILEICQKKEQEIDVYRMKLSKASYELERKKLN